MYVYCRYAKEDKMEHIYISFVIGFTKRSEEKKGFILVAPNILEKKKTLLDKVVIKVSCDGHK